MLFLNFASLFYSLSACDSGLNIGEAFVSICFDIFFFFYQNFSLNFFFFLTVYLSLQDFLRYFEIFKNIPSEKKTFQKSFRM